MKKFTITLVILSGVSTIHASVNIQYDRPGRALVLNVQNISQVVCNVGGRAGGELVATYLNPDYDPQRVGQSQFCQVYERFVPGGDTAGAAGAPLETLGEEEEV